MALGRSGVLGIEVGAKRLRVLYGAVSGPSLRIYDFGSEEILISNPENAAQQLEAVVSRKKLRNSLAALAVSGPGIVHRLLDFPPMPLKELAVVVEREMRAVGTSAERDAFYDWEVLEGDASGGLKERRVLVAMAPKSQVEGALQLLDQCHLRPALVTTVPVALLRSLGFVQDARRGLRAIVYLGDEQGYLLAVKDGVWGFNREFSRGVSEEGLEVFVREAKRAILYQRQRFRGGGTITYLLGGERGLEKLQARFQKEMEMPGEIARPGQALDLSPLEERRAIFEDQFPSFILPLGLVAASYAKSKVNLIPKDSRATAIRWPSIDLSFVRRPIAAFVVLLVLLAIHLFVIRTGRSYERLLGERTALYAQWLPAIRAAQESRRYYESQQLLEEALGSRPTEGPPWVRLFKTLSVTVPPDLVLQSMDIRRGEDQWIISLKGEVLAADNYAAQVTFNLFYQRLKESVVEQIDLAPPSVSTLEDKTRVQFEVRGRWKGA